ncbi:2-deoxy-D-gluconate 3-dehydrogenase [Pontibacillus halophilus JSM 076056 = DSM 19796]|uniref:2-deoxy-D-gluconate 3-dehydrogenase n=1 Tax=Pontibacillus halophilus JSM 076056 = DSM 19796 TaxID=1385510 RepID=A0A0A5I7W9_9BACI|nr:glucose 1-dehydrogenase [Pontibacillus halophilus]KGX91932.1 2-deoxy-D-gluconate 3-dehydrogenase [Pontibacillus halophilus JSM 076056 = DSM 19796]
MYLPSFRLDGKLAVITGATKGIGRGIAHAYAESGADLLVIARTKEDLVFLKEELTPYDTNVYIVEGDVQQHKALIVSIEAVIPDRHIDIWVNNAGMNIRSKAKDVTEEEWATIVDTNMKSAFFLSQYAAHKMSQERVGKIINVSSVAGTKALRTGVVYGMTKAALIQMTKNLALEWGGDNLTVNAIGPWYFETPLTETVLQDEQYVNDILARTPLNRIGELKELAGVAVFLASEASNYMTGQTLFVDGGMSIYGF